MRTELAAAPDALERVQGLDGRGGSRRLSRRGQASSACTPWQRLALHPLQEGAPRRRDEGEIGRPRPRDAAPPPYPRPPPPRSACRPWSSSPPRDAPPPPSRRRTAASRTRPAGRSRSTYGRCPSPASAAPPFRGRRPGCARPSSTSPRPRTRARARPAASFPPPRCRSGRKSLQLLRPGQPARSPAPSRPGPSRSRRRPTSWPWAIEEGVGHAAADGQLVELGHQVLQQVELGGDLRSADDAHAPVA